jgi:NAD(P)-dependent dehydrogenase (short-subunit alcohol dehydrogenase family)
MLTYPGIGRSIAHTYAQNGISALALADISLPALEATQVELLQRHPHLADQVAIYTVNVTKEEEISAAVQSAAQRFGRIDISIHGAGISGVGAHTHELDLKEWQRVIDVNQTGVMLCDKWMVKQMLGQELIPGYRGRGIIVNISSIYGVVAPDGRIGAAPYAASKHGMLGRTLLLLL